MAAAAAAGADAEGIDIPFTDSARTMDYKLLKALQKGDVKFVRRFLSQETVAFEHLEEGHRSWRGVTVGGNSALHIVADFGHLKLAEMICEKMICARESSLLAARNVALETPLHCAARAGAHRIMSHFITVGEKDGGCWLNLRATDREGKTALHAAAQEGHAAAARVLMSADPGLAAIVDGEGVSPLYLAVLSGSLEIVQILIRSYADGGETETPVASYAGPNGKTALHAAAMIGNPEIAKKLLQWESILTKIVDNSKSSPLHYLATTYNHYMVRELLKHDTSPAYFSDSKGLCPVHVAARMGKFLTVTEFINSCPDMCELVDGGGRNFLHVAVAHNRVKIVRFVSKHPFLMKMMNAKDCEGNTPLHLAVKSKNRIIVSLLLKNKSVQLSIVNQNGETPLDLAAAGIDFGLSFTMNPDIWIFRWLKLIGAVYGRHRLDQLVDEMTTKLDQEKELTNHEKELKKLKNQEKELKKLKNQEKELKKYKTTVQSQAFVSILIATVTFASAFTMPGGYKADDHQNGGTPTLATKSAFMAFIFSDSLAFIFSIMATIRLMHAGSLTVDPSLRQKFIIRSTFYLFAAVHGMVTAFAMAVYVVLAPVNNGIAISICVLCFTSILFSGGLNIRQVYRLICIQKSRQGWLGICKMREALKRPI